MSLPDAYRGTGRTQCMIDELVTAVLDGQPRSIVVVRDSHQVVWMRERIIKSLSARGANCTSLARDWIDVGGCAITIMPAHQHAARTAGLRGHGEFWDHSALELADPVPAPPGMLIQGLMS